MYDYRCTVLRILDADTLACDADLGCDVSVRLTIRLAGLDCPERNTPEGVQARNETTIWVAEHADALRRLGLRTTKDRREKFGRYLGELYDLGTGDSLNDHLLSVGAALPYDGHGPRPSATPTVSP